MKNKADKDFHQLRTKIFIQTIAMLAAAVAVIYVIYSFLLRGNFANLMLALLQNVFGMEYDAALAFHERTFRRHMNTILWLSMLLVFYALFQIYLRWFTRYFEEINRGMDNLLQNAPGEICLSPGLFPIERKMNLAKHTIERQKSDMLTAEQKKNDLVMYLAHDLKTPLASAISYLNLLRDEREISEELREKYLSISLAKAERLEDLINEFLEVAKYNLSAITLQYSEINLTLLLEQLIFEFQPILDKKNLTCRLEIQYPAANNGVLDPRGIRQGPTDASIWDFGSLHAEMTDGLIWKCDADKMQRVFDNLLRNAAIYSFEGTEITVTAERDSNNLTLRFSNNGSTIPKEKLERVFEQFYRLDTGRDTSGAGLGLAIARQIVTLHGGTITAASENDLTVFTVILPIL